MNGNSVTRIGFTETEIIAALMGFEHEQIKNALADPRIVENNKFRIIELIGQNQPYALFHYLGTFGLSVKVQMKIVDTMAATNEYYGLYVIVCLATEHKLPEESRDEEEKLNEVLQLTGANIRQTAITSGQVPWQVIERAYEHLVNSQRIEEVLNALSGGTQDNKCLKRLLCDFDKMMDAILSGNDPKKLEYTLLAVIKAEQDPQTNALIKMKIRRRFAELIERIDNNGGLGVNLLERDQETLDRLRRNLLASDGLMPGGILKDKRKQQSFAPLTPLKRQNRALS